MEEDYKQQLIEFQREQLDRYHEYMLIALNNTGTSTGGGFINNAVNNVNFKPLSSIMQENLENMPLEMMNMFFETAENADHGAIALLESALCPDKDNLQFSYQNSSSFVKYNNGTTIVTESIQIFAKYVCDYVHNYCCPHIEGANTNLRNDLEEQEEEVLDTLCKKNLMRVKHLTNLLISSEQVRLVKKLFSMLKNK